MSLITRVSQLFSKPEAKPQLGVAIGRSSLTICYVDQQNKISYQEMALEGNSTQKVATDTLTNQVTNSLMKLSTESKFSGNCQVVLPGSHYQLVQVDKPNVPNNEVVAALKWQVKELVSIDVDDMILDYFDGPTSAGVNAKVNVVCVSKNLLKAIVGSINKNALNLSIISTEVFAFVSLVPEQKDPILLVCQQPNEEIVLLIIKNGVLYFHRRLRGFSEISQQSKQELAMGTVDNLSLEIQRSTDYFERHLKQSPITAIEVMVPIDNEQYLLEKLAQNTDISVRLLALPKPHQGQRKYATAIGASLLSNLEQVDEL